MNQTNLFKMGQHLATPGVLAALTTASQSPAEFISRHARGDWGDMQPEDKQLNDLAVMDADSRIFSGYLLKNGEKIWIITEAGRHATTILLPSEY